jgi:hypothetical protein
LCRRLRVDLSANVVDARIGEVKRDAADHGNEQQEPEHTSSGAPLCPARAVRLAFRRAGPYVRAVTLWAKTLFADTPPLQLVAFARRASAHTAVARVLNRLVKLPL